MPRPPRMLFGGECYHILNRANRKAEVFHQPADYDAFIRLINDAREYVELPILAVCLMPNHVHLVVRPIGNEDISRWMQWLFTTHARRYNDRFGKTGHVWQGRYKSVIVQSDHHLLALLRYVERNALRAKLVARAEDWRWSSVAWRARSAPVVLTPSPVPLPPAWIEFVNQPQTAAELEAIRTSVNKQRPFGEEAWVKKRASESGLEQSLANVGRKRKRRSGS